MMYTMLAASLVLTLLALVLDTWATLLRMGEGRTRERKDSELILVCRCHISAHVILVTRQHLPGIITPLTSLSRMFH